MNPITLLTLLVVAGVATATNYGGDYYQGQGQGQQGHGGHVGNGGGGSRRVPIHRQRLHLVPALAAPVVPERFVEISSSQPEFNGPIRTTVINNIPQQSAGPIRPTLPETPEVGLPAPTLPPVRNTFVSAPVAPIVPVAEEAVFPKEHHKITRFEQNIGTDTSNNVSFDTSNGIHTSDKTEILPGTPNPENPSELWNKIQKSGTYSYISPEGIPISVSWTADGINGFRAVSSAIPTPVAPIV